MRRSVNAWRNSHHRPLRSCRNRRRGARSRDPARAARPGGAAYSSANPQPPCASAPVRVVRCAGRDCAGGLVHIVVHPWGPRWAAGLAGQSSRDGPRDDGPCCPGALHVDVLRLEGILRERSSFWLGAVAYIIYQAVLFLFGTPFNSLFLLYVAMLSLGFWSAVVLMWQIDLAAFGARFDRNLPARGIAIYALVLAVLNALVWLRTIVPAMLSDSPSCVSGRVRNDDQSGVRSGSGAVASAACGGVLVVVEGRPLGQLVVGAMLVMLLLESIGVATDQWFGAMADPDTPFASMAAVPLFLGLAIVGAVPLFFYMRHLDARRGTVPRSKLRTHHQSTTFLTTRSHLGPPLGRHQRGA